MKKAIIWIGALIVGAILGLFGIAWLDEVMNFVATVYTRLFQLLAVPTIVLAVITTFATFGSKGSGRIFGHTLTYTLLTTFAAAAVGAVLYVLVAPGNLPVETISNDTHLSPLTSHLSYIDHIISVIPNNIVKPFFDGNVLSLLLLAFAVGIGLSKLPESENKAVVVKFLVGLQELLFLLIHWLIWTLPLGHRKVCAGGLRRQRHPVLRCPAPIPIDTRPQPHTRSRAHDACRTHGAVYQE